MKKIVIRSKNPYTKYMIKRDFVYWLKTNIYGIISIILMGIIFIFSSQTGNESAHVSNYFENVITNFIGSNYLIIPIRKLAHLILYFLLGHSIFTHFRYKYKFNYKVTYYIISFIVTTLYACTDEIHQLFVPGRGSQLTDIFIDSTGCILALLINFIIISLLEIKDKNKKLL